MTEKELLREEVVIAVRTAYGLEPEDWDVLLSDILEDATIDGWGIGRTCAAAICTLQHKWDLDLHWP